MQGQIRTIKDHVGARTGASIARRSDMFKCLTEWSAATLTRYKILSHGENSFATIKGRQSHAQIAAFGEIILYVPLKSMKTGRSKFEPKMEEGIFLGMNMRTDDILVGTERGTVNTRTFKRLQPDERWKAELVRAVSGSPNQPVPGVPRRHTHTD